MYDEAIEMGIINSMPHQGMIAQIFQLAIMDSMPSKDEILEAIRQGVENAFRE